MATAVFGFASRLVSPTSSVRRQARILNCERLENRELMHGDSILDWNAIALQAVADDHTPWIVSSPDQGGPTKTSRALAIVHLAMYNAYNAIDGSNTPYLNMRPGPATADLDAAVAKAARDTLVAMFPKQRAVFDQALTDYLAEIPDGLAERQGIRVGKTAAALILNARQYDRSNVMMNYTSRLNPGKHRVDPKHPEQGFLTPKWGVVKPFAMTSGSQFRAPPPPALNSAAYAAAFEEVKWLGGDGITTPTVRTEEETQIGIFWGYDGAPGLGTPPRLYNQIVRAVSEQECLTEAENARLFALVNVAMADAGIAAWETKYVYSFWRPILGIRESDPGTGPTGRGDGNGATYGDPDWTPLGAPGSNGAAGGNFTPPFPAYVSGHAAFGAAMFHTLTRFFGTDQISFSFQSDEFNGETTDQYGNVRPEVTRYFSSFSEASWENAESRIFLGIHWRFDATAGMEMGENIADWVFERYLRPTYAAPQAAHGIAVTSQSLVVASA